MGTRRALLALLALLLIFNGVGVLASGNDVEPLVQQGASLDMGGRPTDVVRLTWARAKRFSLYENY